MILVDHLQAGRNVILVGYGIYQAFRHGDVAFHLLLYNVGLAHKIEAQTVDVVCFVVY